MNRILSFRIVLAGGVSLLAHLVVFAAVGPAGAPAGDPARIAGGGADIHFGTPPGSAVTPASTPNPQPASMRAPPAAPVPKQAPPASEPAIRKPAAPSLTRALPDAAPNHEPDPLKPDETPPSAPAAFRSTEADTSPSPPAEAMASAPNVGDSAATGSASGPTGQARGHPGTGDPRAAADVTAASAMNASDMSGPDAGPGNAASTNYAGLVMQHLSRVRRPRASSPGSAFVSFTIGSHGELEDVRISKSSRSARFDRDALTVVRRAAPFPPPPAGVNCAFSVEIEGE